MGLNTSYLGKPKTTIEFPYNSIGIPQLNGYNATAPTPYSQVDVQDGPARRKLDNPTGMFVWDVQFIFRKAEAKVFEDFYFDTVKEGLFWFKIPLSFSTGLQLCTVRSRPGTPYQMVRLGPHYQYTWPLEGFGGPSVVYP